MYSKQEASTIKRKFWTTLGMYMKPVPSAWQEKVNWLNYKTGIKDIYFRMHADNKLATIGIEITHSDPMIRQIFFEHFVAMKTMLHDLLGEPWDWIPESHDEHGKPISLIQTQQMGVNIMDEKHWPGMISFFKPRLIALDAFWGDVRDSMEGW
jgi:hypothetical protein